MLRVLTGTFTGLSGFLPGKFTGMYGCSPGFHRVSIPLCMYRVEHMYYRSYERQHLSTLAHCVLLVTTFSCSFPFVPVFEC